MIKTDKRIEQLKESNKELRKRLKKSASIIRKHVISKYLYHGRSFRDKRIYRTNKRRI